MGKQELDSIGDPYALLLAGLVERERVSRVEKKKMQNFLYLQETLVFNKTAAPIQESDARKRLTSSIPGMSSRVSRQDLLQHLFLSVRRPLFWNLGRHQRITVQETITEYLFGRQVPKLGMISPSVLTNYLRPNLQRS